MVDLSFAGRQRNGHPVHDAIAAARIADPVTLLNERDRWHLQDSRGRILGRMSKSFAPPLRTRFIRGEIATILRRRKEDGDDSYHHMLRRDSWEVIIPELVFETL